MSIRTERELFDRELQKLYHAEIEILDLHKDLAAAATNDRVKAIFSDHEGDTIDQIDRIEAIFSELDREPREHGSSLMEGLMAEKDEFIAEVDDPNLRELNVLSVGIINEQLEITLLDRLLLLARNLDLPPTVISHLSTTRDEAEAALATMRSVLDSWGER